MAIGAVAFFARLTVLSALFPINLSAQTLRKKQNTALSAPLKGEKETVFV